MDDEFTLADLLDAEPSRLLTPAEQVELPELEAQDLRAEMSRLRAPVRAWALFFVA
jgi:hypothetical protein